MKQARFWLVCLFFAFWAIAITSRLFWLQIVRHQDYVERAAKQQQRTFQVAPRRGVLYDRNMHELAMTVQVDSIYAVPNEIDDNDKRELARTLASVVHSDAADQQTSAREIEKRLDDGHGFAWIARRVTPDVSTRVRALNLKGVYLQKEFERFYPNKQIAAQVLGYVGLDDNGLGGIEQKFDTRLHGTPGQVLTAVDARRHVLGSVEHEPEPGQNMQLTIDEHIQFMAENALDHVMAKEHADNGTIVVQDVHTGQILALAIRPTFDPNDFRHTTPKLLKNHAVSDVYEPGSVFKLVAYSAAMDSNVAKPDDMVDCQGGQITIAGRVIHDNQGEHYGVIPVHQALEVSSDVGAIKMALKVGQDRYYDYIRAFGFGQRTGVELPGETRGLLRPVKKWTPSSIGSVAMGQEVGVTPIQLVSMVSAIANGGTYLPPHVLISNQPTNPQTGTAQPAMQPVAFRLNEELPNPMPPGAHRVISEMASAEMRKMMEGVVLYGSGKPAQLNGYSSGGKTGTAQKIDPATHLYSKTMHIASFAGFAPVNNPAIAVAVVIDNPHGGGSYYGTAVSAPVFGEVAQQALEYLQVPHDIDVQQPKTTQAKAKPAPVAEDDAVADQNDVNDLFAAVNDLPADDPLRAPPVQAAQPVEAVQHASVTGDAKSKPSPGQSADLTTSLPAATPQAAAPSQPSEHKAVPQMLTVSDGKQFTVPSLVGMPMRRVIESVQSAGLDLQIIGSGTAREQAPAPGTKVPTGTKIIVRFGH